MNNRSYTDLTKLSSFKERFDYLKLDGSVGEQTFGFDRYLNQSFYQHNPKWRSIRQKVIIRDNGCDLGIPDRPINGPIYVHHINPITTDDIIHNSDWILDPEYLICTSFNTHQAIHYSNEDILVEDFVERSPNDTKLWG